MIQLEHLSKRFGSFTAVHDLCLDVAEGEIFGFLGPNGAGKPTTGRVVLGGHDLAKEPLLAKAISAFVPDRPFVYEKISGREFLDFVGGLYQVAAATRQSRIDES